MSRKVCSPVVNKSLQGHKVASMCGEKGKRKFLYACAGFSGDWFRESLAALLPVWENSMIVNKAIRATNLLDIRNRATYSPPTFMEFAVE